MSVKKWLALLFAFLIGAISLFGCGGETETPVDPTPPGGTEEPIQPGEPEQPEDPGEAEVVFTDLWTDGFSHSFAAGESYTLELGAALGGNDYLKLSFETACGLDGTMYFSDGDAREETAERFYIGGGDTEFRQILFSAGDAAKLERIEFRCVAGSGEFRLNAVSAAVHPLDLTQDQLWLTGKTVKLGITLKHGGAVNWLSSIHQMFGLSVDDQGKVSVGEYVKGTSLVADDVNLVNAYDTGRLIQQSFYGSRGDSIANPKDDYECGTYDPDGNPETPAVVWPYNPVQGGDQYQNLPQIVDVRLTESEIYVKSRPMDWAKNNSVTPFYMENTYRIEEDPVYGEYVCVVNRSTDFSGYVHDNVRDQELPAFYGITPLGTLTTYTGNAPWSGEACTNMTSLGFWGNGGAENRFNATENWIAWVNEEGWGVGLYVPDVERMLAGRNGYFPFAERYEQLGSDPSNASPCTYTAPLGVFSLPTYESFTYTYYLKLDYADQSRAFFGELHAQGASNEDVKRLEGRA